MGLREWFLAGWRVKIAATVRGLFASFQLRTAIIYQESK